MITKKSFVAIAIVLLSFSYGFARDIATAEVMENSPPFGQSVNMTVTESDADKYFYLGLKANNKKQKEAYLNKSLEKCMLLLKYRQDDVMLATQVAVIHDNLGHSHQANDYFYRAVSIQNDNPFANFYYGEYYFARRDYQNALKYYLTAYDNGYDSFYELNLKLGTVYERLGDIRKAKHYYTVAFIQNPDLKELSSKIMSLNDVYYSKSDYKK